MASAKSVGIAPAPTLVVAGRYELGDFLGRGADGETYAGVDRTSGAACAVKLLVAVDRAAEDRLRGEFARLSTLAHRSIQVVRDIGRVEAAADTNAGVGVDGGGGRFYLVSDRIAGEPLASIAAITDISARSVAFRTAARDLADALAYLHARGAVHGDVSPANVRLGADGRPVLLDFGPALPSKPGTAVGTLGFASPEALVGRREPAGDLFSLGATLFAAWTGTPPFGVGIQAVGRMLAGPAPALSEVRPGLPPEWDDIVRKLLEVAPADRFASARELLRAVARAQADDGATLTLAMAAPSPAGDPLVGITVGRAEERGVLMGSIERLAEGGADCAVVTVSGPPGCGRRTLLEGMLRDARIACAAGTLPAIEIYAGSIAGLARLVGFGGASGDGGGGRSPSSTDDDRDGDPARARQASFAGLADALEARAAAGRPLCVILQPDPDAEAFAGYVAGADPSGRLLLLLPALRGLSRAGARDIALRPLRTDDVLWLCRRAVEAAGEDEAPVAAITAVAAASAGHAATAALLARRLVDAVRQGTAERFSAAGGGDGLSVLLDQSLTALPADARRLVAALALAQGSAALSRVAGLAGSDLADAEARARTAGWIADGVEAGADPVARGIRLPSQPHCEAALRALGDGDLRSVAWRALDHLADTDARRGDALAALGELLEAADAFRSAARAAASEAGAFASGESAAHLQRAAALAPASLTWDERLALAEGLGFLGRYGEALSALRVLAEPGREPPDAEQRAALAERQAWLLGRSGDLRAALSVLEVALAEADPSGGAGPGDRLRGRLARLLVSAGQLDRALSIAAPALAEDRDGDGGGSGIALSLEAATLAHAYAGQPTQARALLQRLAGRVRDAARMAYLRGLVDHMDGHLTDAAVAYREAYAAFAARGDVHLLAATALNLGSVLAASGCYGEALPVLARAVRELGRLGATTELGPALFNVGILLTELGDVEAARRAIARAREEGRARGAAMVGAYAAHVEGDLRRREGLPPAAAALYREAASGLEQAGNGAGARAARLALAEALAEAGDTTAASAALTAAGPGDDDETTLASGRVMLRRPALDPAAGEAAATRLAEVSAQAAAAGRRVVGWRAAGVAARIFDRLGKAAAAQDALAEARRIFEEVRMATPASHRPGLQADSEARWLSTPGLGGAAAAAAGPHGYDAARAARTEGLLRRLLRVNKRLNSEQRLPRLLEMIVDTVIELTDAERGFLLLEDDGGELAVRVARNIDQRTLDAADFELSRSIARQAATGGQPIVTIDAAGDSRFREAVSVSDLRLRSVLAVPLTVRGRAVGTIYVDHRLRQGAFGDDDVAVVLDFAEQAAIAIENARLLAEVRRRERQIDALNRRLESELAAGREELTGMRQELRENRDALAIRYDYRNIVGRTPRMQELFRLLDRVTDTMLPAVIQGESGTGKELVARAIHFNGPRRERPFVSENCAAIPETLLESTLFGYARGAFTGADHDARGLFEVADGGTLFLDEIGEMSPAMQGKLLRVLQDGEFRRVGSERPRKVDVRILAATNRDLHRMVEDGTFRQDLFFRINVVRISLPSLRERHEDIPLIVAHICAKLAGDAGKPKTVAPAALARLCAYRWPGNVRELENEIQRAYAMSGATITAADLAHHVLAGAEGGSSNAVIDPESLSLKPRVERLERMLIREALARMGGNQTKAAVALGLSRFGLQKKLRRYRIGG